MVLFTRSIAWVQCWVVPAWKGCRLQYSFTKECQKTRIIFWQFLNFTWPLAPPPNHEILIYCNLDCFAPSPILTHCHRSILNLVFLKASRRESASVLHCHVCKMYNKHFQEEDQRGLKLNLYHKKQKMNQKVFMKAQFLFVYGAEIFGPSSNRSIAPMYWNGKRHRRRFHSDMGIYVFKIGGCFLTSSQR